MSHPVSFRDNVLQELAWQNQLWFVARISALVEVALLILMALDPAGQPGPILMSLGIGLSAIVVLGALTLAGCSRLSLSVYYFLAEGHRDVNLGR